MIIGFQCYESCMVEEDYNEFMKSPDTMLLEVEKENLNYTIKNCRGQTFYDLAQTHNKDIYNHLQSIHPLAGENEYDIVLRVSAEDALPRVKRNFNVIQLR